MGAMKNRTKCTNYVLCFHERSTGRNFRKQNVRCQRRTLQLWLQFKWNRVNSKRSVHGAKGTTRLLGLFETKSLLSSTDQNTNSKLKHRSTYNVHNSRINFKSRISCGIIFRGKAPKVISFYFISQHVLEGENNLLTASVLILCKEVVLWCIKGQLYKNFNTEYKRIEEILEKQSPKTLRDISDLTEPVSNIYKSVG